MTKSLTGVAADHRQEMLRLSRLRVESLHGQDLESQLPMLQYTGRHADEGPQGVPTLLDTKTNSTYRCTRTSCSASPLS